MFPWGKKKAISSFNWKAPYLELCYKIFSQDQKYTVKNYSFSSNQTNTVTSFVSLDINIHQQNTFFVVVVFNRPVEYSNWLLFFHVTNWM